MACHPERSEGSRVWGHAHREILRCAQDDTPAESPWSTASAASRLRLFLPRAAITAVSAPAREDGTVRGSELGAAIRTFRMRRLQIHNGQPWTLDDLAVAMDDDKGHLSRIERGQIVPGRATLMRMARALALSWPETEYLLRLAG